MGCDHPMLRSGELCGRTPGHRGSHLTPQAAQREAERMRLRRTTPGTCTARGCDSPRIRYWATNTYDARCVACKYRDGQRQAARHRLKALGELVGDEGVAALGLVLS